MNQDFRKLHHQPLSSKTLIAGFDGRSDERISLDDPALSIMTDFRHVRPFQITPTASMDETNQRMIACGVRLLFIAEDDDILQGLITYNDIFGEKPVRYLQEHGGLRDEIMTRDIMTPLDQLEALQLTDISNACIGDILTTIQNSGRQHLLVVKDQPSEGVQIVTGLFSSTQMEKQLGMKIELSTRANTFSDVERALSD